MARRQAWTVAILLLAVACPVPGMARSKVKAGIDPQAIDDAALDFRVRAALLQELGDDGLDITIATDGGRVSLTGSVCNADELARATKAAQAVAQVRGVENRLTIERPLPEGARELRHPGRSAHAVDDALLEARIKTRLVEAFGVRALRLSIDADQGSVEVAGSVPTKDDRDQALETVREVLGVEFVRDQVKIDRSLKKSLVATAETPRVR